METPRPDDHRNASRWRQDPAATVDGPGAEISPGSEKAAEETARAGRLRGPYRFPDRLVHPARGWELIIATTLIGLVLLAAAATSFPRRVGDGHEYMAMALSVANLDRPAPNPEQLIRIKDDLAALEGGFLSGLDRAELIGADGRQDFPHFWMYPALSAPFVALAELIGQHPNWGFTALNLLLLLGAFAVLAGSYSPAVGALMIVGPIMWWVDKAHTEAFTFAALAAAVALLRDRPWWTMVLAGLASTQNLPIAILVPVAAAVAILPDRTIWRDRRFQLGAAGGLALSLLHPLYYFTHLGSYTSQARMGVVGVGIPDRAHLMAPLLDPNIGMLAGFPLLVPAVLVLAASAAAGRRLRPGRAEIGGLLIAAAVWLVAFSQNNNINHGGTPGMSRYALWLIPLVIPVIGWLATSLTRRGAAAFVLIVAVSGFASWQAFDPSKPDGQYWPSWIGSWIWENAPQLDNPPVQIFVERAAHAEIPAHPVGTASCSKVIVIDGVWPDSCPPPPSLPDLCRTSFPHAASEVGGPACYANRTGDGYSYAAAP